MTLQEDIERFFNIDWNEWKRLIVICFLGVCLASVGGALLGVYIDSIIEYINLFK